MKQIAFIIALLSIGTTSLYAQRGVRIAYIDTEYILQNVPEYIEASTQLERKADKWKTEIEAKLSDLEQKRKALNSEKVLLTDAIIEEREEDLKYEEGVVMEYQQKRFGPKGDLVFQKQQIMQPIQDQIFSAVQDIAASRKYDFIFDKSADVVMLYSAKQYDLSDQILRVITRASKRNQLKTRAERKAAKAERVVPEVKNEALEARQTALEKKRAARAAASKARREEILEARKTKREAVEARRQKLKDERNKKLGKAKIPTDTLGTPGTTTSKAKSRAEALKAERAKKIAEREIQKKELLEKRKKALEERRKKSLEERRKKVKNKS